MGNVLSGDEKSSKRLKEKFQRKNLNGIEWINQQYGYHQIRKEDHRFRDRRNTSFHFKNGGNQFPKSKSHSLDAIFEELYLSGTEENSSTGPLFNYTTNRPFIPRIKLTRSVSNLREEKRYKLFKMSAEPEILHFEDSENSKNKSVHLKEDDEQERSTNNSPVFLNNNNNNEYNETLKKPDENYFTKNFDECMKRLQLIEKEHELIEKVDSNIKLYFLNDQQQIENSKAEQEQDFRVDVKIEDETENAKPLNGDEKMEEGAINHNKRDNVEKTETSDDDTTTIENQQSITEWYSSVKQHFENPKTEEQNPKEMSCRITGATLKNSNEIQKAEDKKEETRHYFSRLVKSNKSLIDEELPDPDKVKNIRAMFQENLNSTLKRKLDKKLGGSLQNISVRSGEQHLSRPLSALCNRDDVIEEIRENHKAEENKDKSSETQEFKECEKDIEATKRKLFEKYEKDTKIGKDFRGRKLLPPKWTDTGSMSSGVSSDLSSYDTDLESYSREGPEPEPEPDEVTISDDDLLEEVKDKHYVQNEILEKIRSFGTSVTYYGGEMITCSVGPLLSPTAQAIMEEIGEKYGNESSPTRSFDEFYRKYIETNEPNRKKKLGRARSFGQNDVFQRPNVLSNTEIEMYKNDLELEIGIKKPTGIPQNGLKLKLTKSNSLDSRSDKVETKLPQTPIITIDVVSENENKNQSSEETEFVETNTNQESSSGEMEAEEKEESPNPQPCKMDEKTPVNPSVEREDVKEICENRSERKERLFERSKSAPDGLKDSSDNSQLPSNEILFGYEKSLLNGKRKSDMEFEEFEVCETVTEKLEKLEEVNASGYQNSTPNVENDTKPNESETNKTKTETELRRKWNINLNEEIENNNNNNNNNNNFDVGKVQGSVGRIEEPEMMVRSKPSLSRSQSETKYTRYSQSRWPIETTVVVDIQKNNEQTPKVILNGKTSKTKLRLF